MRLLILLAIVAVALADLPIHCLVDSVYGKWAVSVGPSGADRTEKCTSFTPASTMVLDFQKPNIVVDDKGNKGTWTIMYDEGIEVFINDLDFYTWFYYSGSSYKCDKTMNGWYHSWPAKLAQKDWGCWSMTKQKSDEPMKTMYQADKYMDRSIVLDAAMAKEICEYVNSVQSSWVCDPNSPMVGKTLGELRNMVGRRAKNAPKTQLKPYVKPATVPDVWDWRSVKGVDYVSPVRDQGGCGSCYAFSTTGMLEARIRVLTNNTQKPVLSVEDVISCDDKYSQGCSGGFEFLVGKYGEDYGIVEESCFKYAGYAESCSSKCKTPTKVWYATKRNYVGVYDGACTAAAMQEDIYANGPESVGILWGGVEMFLYKSGVLTHVTGGPMDRLNWEELNHAVVAVGWGKSGSSHYWIVKNSWGSSWGDKGYFTVTMGKDEMGIESEGVSVEPVI